MGHMEIIRAAGRLSLFAGRLDQPSASSATDALKELL
jgi:hypothetical protein